MTGKNIRKLVLAALLAALTAVATMIIRIPTPTQGYIHLGDGMVLICGISARSPVWVRWQPVSAR